MLAHLGQEWTYATRAEPLRTKPTLWLPNGRKFVAKRPQELNELLILHMQNTNPDEDIMPTGKPEIRILEQVAKCYDKQGRFASSITKTKLHDLWNRFQQAEEDGLHTAMKVSSFEHEILLLLERYPTKTKEHKNATRKNRHLKNHWALPAKFMSEIIHEGLGVKTEMFASPLNVHENTEIYFSQFHRDKIFGSSGDAYATQWSGFFQFNPEYEPEALAKAMIWAAMASKESTAPVFGVGIYPGWANTAERKYIETLS